MFLYLDFGKFKSESKRLKRALKRSYPDRAFTLTVCQNLIAQSLALADFNQLFLAHKRKLKETLGEFHVHLGKYNSLRANEWVEFSPHSVFSAWIKKRKHHLYRIIHDTYGEPDNENPVEPDNVLSSVWRGLLKNARLPETTLLHQSFQPNLLNEKNWREGVVAMVDHEPVYMRLLKKCLPKLANDGGIAILTESQAIEFVDAWNNCPSKRVSLTVFNIDHTTRKGSESKRESPLKEHCKWPLFNGEKDDAPLLKSFQFGDINTSSCMKPVPGNERSNMWLGKAIVFLQSYYMFQSPHYSRCDAPSLSECIDIAYNEDIPLICRQGLVDRLRSIDLTLPASRGDVVIKKRHEEFFSYQADLLTFSSSSMNSHYKGITPIRLSDWTENPQMTVFVVSEKSEGFAKNFIEGMLTALCHKQTTLASHGNLKRMSKGLFVSPSPANYPYAMSNVPRSLCENTLWGWVFTPGENFDSKKAGFIFRERDPLIISGD